MSIHEIIKLPLGTKIYRIYEGKIKAMCLLAPCPKFPDKYFYFINDYAHTDSFGVYIPKDNYHYEVEYEIAKEVMWEQKIEELEDVNEVYFNNKKELKLC